MTGETTERLLDGMRVLDTSVWRPMPYATQLLADLGAEVLKVEPPGGDPMRAFPELFADVASGKRSVVLDLRSEGGRARCLELARDADVFCEGWRPGVAARLGLSYDDVRAVNPAVVYCSLSGFGQTGPLTDRPGHDVNYQALAGALRPPVVPRVPVADLAGGMAAALLIAAAWARRVRTGEGERIDVAMADVVASWSGPYQATAMAHGRVAGSPGYGVFECADGRFVALGVLAEDRLWQAICAGLALSDLHELSYAQRLERVDDCNARVARAISSLDRDTALARLADAGAPATAVNGPAEAAAEAQFRERGVFVEPEPGSLRVAFPAVLLHHPAKAPGAVPAPGEHGSWA